MRIKIDIFDPASIGVAIDQLQAYAKSLPKKAEEICKNLSRRGYTVAYETLGQHIYTGETIQSLKVEQVGKGKYRLSAGSTALLFLEFGAGIMGTGHPQAGEFGMGAGTYPNQKHAFDPNGWWYPTDDPNLIVRTDKDGNGYGHSYGNPPYMPMYQAEEKIKHDILEVAKEVFKE